MGKKEEFVRVCDECKVERDEYVKAKENKFMCYSDATVVFKGTKEEKERLDAMGDTDGDSEENDVKRVDTLNPLLTQTTFDITKEHLVSPNNERMSKRRARMSLHRRKSNPSCAALSFLCF